MWEPRLGVQPQLQGYVHGQPVRKLTTSLGWRGPLSHPGLPGWAQGRMKMGLGSRAGILDQVVPTAGVYPQLLCELTNPLHSAF